MKLRWNVLGAVVLGLGLVGCGVTVGSSCTSDDECGDMGFCINQKNTPGGYCSQPCVPFKDDTCPSGSTCVEQGASEHVSACFFKCTTNSDCRSSNYQCISNFRGNPFSVCAVPDPAS
jgi:hypothetical protein